jgi:hypothetical protein
MADLVLDIIKSMLYERQPPEEGQLDGTLYLFKGQVKLVPGINFHKSIYPTYLIMERWRAPNKKPYINKIYYKVYVQRTEEEVFLIRKKENCEIHYFTNPIGSMNIITSIFQRLDQQMFSFILQNVSIGPVISWISTVNYFVQESNINERVKNILLHFKHIDFEMHQLNNKYIGGNPE